MIVLDMVMEMNEDGSIAYMHAHESQVPKKHFGSKVTGAKIYFFETIEEAEEHSPKYDEVPPGEIKDPLYLDLNNITPETLNKLKEILATGSETVASQEPASKNWLQKMFNI